MTKKSDEKENKQANLVIGLSISGTLLVMVLLALFYLFKTKKLKMLHKSIFFTLNAPQPTARTTKSSSRGNRRAEEADVALLNGLCLNFFFGFVFSWTEIKQNVPSNR